jgi:hypothetical protein
VQNLRFSNLLLKTQILNPAKLPFYAQFSISVEHGLPDCGTTI